jgi:phosphatidylglycerophosphatase C
VSGIVVFDLDKVLLGGDASTLFFSGRLRQAPGRVLPLLAAAPVLLPGSALPQTRPLAARLMTRVALGGRGADRAADVAAIAEAYGAALVRKPHAAVADAIARAREHEAAGETVVVATGCEETLARGFLAAVGLGHLDVVGSTGVLRHLRVRRAMGAEKARMLAERGYPAPWTAVYSDSPSDLPLFSGTGRPVLVNAADDDVAEVSNALGRRPESVTWR